MKQVIATFSPHAEQPVRAAVWVVWRLTVEMTQRFGPEYDRKVERLNNRDDAERELRAREARVTGYKTSRYRRKTHGAITTNGSRCRHSFVDEFKVAKPISLFRKS
jgi:hypothetical protein